MEGRLDPAGMTIRTGRVECHLDGSGVFPAGRFVDQLFRCMLIRKRDASRGSGGPSQAERDKSMATIQYTHRTSRHHEKASSMTDRPTNIKHIHNEQFNLLSLYESPPAVLLTRREKAIILR